jgi:hypothetical protein
MTIVFANVLGCVAAFLILFGQFLIKRGTLKKGYSWSFAGAILMVLSVSLLDSWPVIALYSVLANIYFYGLGGGRIFSRIPITPKKINKEKNNLIVMTLLWILGLACLFLAWAGNEKAEDVAAWACVFLVLFGYLLLFKNVIAIKSYLTLCAISTAGLFPHLISHQNYGALTNGLLALFLSISPIVKELNFREIFKIEVKKKTSRSITAEHGLAPHKDKVAPRSSDDRVEPRIDSFADFQ